jgi:hypothetical protein
MFTLTPGGEKGGAGGGPPSQLRTNLGYFGKLGLYFGAIRFAYSFFAGRESSQRLTAAAQ